MTAAALPTLEIPESEYRALVIEMIERTAQLVHALNKMPGVRALISVEYVGPDEMRHPPNWPRALCGARSQNNPNVVCDREKGHKAEHTGGGHIWLLLPEEAPR